MKFSLVLLGRNQLSKLTAVGRIGYEIQTNFQKLDDWNTIKVQNKTTPRNVLLYRNTMFHTLIL